MIHGLFGYLEMNLALKSGLTAENVITQRGLSPATPAPPTHPASSLLDEGPSRSYSPVGCCLQMWVLSQAIVSCCCKLLFKIISLLSSELQPAHTTSILDIFNFHLCQIITKYFSSFLKKSLSNQVYLLNISDLQAETLWPRETILLLAQSICHISIFH